jgi:hypothetical protein
LKPLTCCGISSSYISHNLYIPTSLADSLRITRLRLPQQTTTQTHISILITPFDANYHFPSYSDTTLTSSNTLTCLHPRQTSSNLPNWTPSKLPSHANGIPSCPKSSNLRSHPVNQTQTKTQTPWLVNLANPGRVKPSTLSPAQVNHTSPC